MKNVFFAVCILFTASAVAQQQNATTNDVTTNKQPPVLTYVEQMPKTAYNLQQYLGENLKYPSGARKKGITGKVLIRFVVNEDGSISDCRVIKGIGGGCDEEALRVIQNMPPWQPGMQKGKPVKVYFTQPISFALTK